MLSSVGLEMCCKSYRFVIDLLGLSVFPSYYTMDAALVIILESFDILWQVNPG